MHALRWPIRTVSEANNRDHWAKKARRIKAHRTDAALLFPAGVPLPVTITLTRVGPRPLDSDNLAISFKACRDGIADKLRVADNDPRITWAYAQQKGKHADDYAVLVTVEARS